MSLPPITVVLVFTPEGDTFQERLDAVPTGPALVAWLTVTQQDYSPEPDVVLVRNVEGFPLEEMQVYGAKQATTDWVAFIGEDEVWHLSLLSTSVSKMIREGAHTLSGDDGLIVVDRSRSPLLGGSHGG